MTGRADPDWRRRLASLFPLCLAYFLASTFILALPMWVGATVAAHIAGETTAGWLATLELGTVALVMLLASRRQPFGSARVHALFAVVAIGSYALSAFATSVWQLAPLRIAAGAGFGWLLAAALAAAARREDPTRTFGVMEICLALYACGFYALVGRAIQADGMRGGFLAMTLCLLACLPAVGALRAEPAVIARPSSLPRRLRAPDWAGVAAHFLFFVVMYSIWTFLAHKAATVDIDARGLGSLLSAAFVAGLAGAALTMALIPAFGRRLVIPGALFVLAGLILLLGHAQGASAFCAAVILIKLCFLFYTVSMSGHFASSDPSGRLNTIGLAMAMIGSSVGPAIGGYGLSLMGFGGLSVAVALGWLLVAGLVLAATSAAPRPSPSVKAAIG